jgi:hypothetical protein
MNKCVLCEFQFATKDGHSEMWSVLNHLAEVHPYFTDELKEAKNPTTPKMPQRLFIEVELLDAQGTWADDEMEALADRVRQTFLWHSMDKEQFCSLLRVTARKEAAK